MVNVRAEFGGTCRQSQKIRPCTLSSLVPSSMSLAVLQFSRLGKIMRKPQQVPCSVACDSHHRQPLLLAVLQQKILLNNILQSRNEQDTSHKLYFSRNMFVVSVFLMFCFWFDCALEYSAGLIWAHTYTIFITLVSERADCIPSLCWCIWSTWVLQSLLSVLIWTLSDGITRSTSSFHSLASVVDSMISSIRDVSVVSCEETVKFKTNHF